MQPAPRTANTRREYSQSTWFSIPKYLFTFENTNGIAVLEDGTSRKVGCSMPGNGAPCASLVLGSATDSTRFRECEENKHEPGPESLMVRCIEFREMVEASLPNTSGSGTSPFSLTPGICQECPVPLQINGRCTTNSMRSTRLGTRSAYVRIQTNTLIRRGIPNVLGGVSPVFPLSSLQVIMCTPLTPLKCCTTLQKIFGDVDSNEVTKDNLTTITKANLCLSALCMHQSPS
jgi:hypothetical protein